MVEVIAAVWLIIVAVQYLSRYFIRGIDVDFTPAYIVMLCLIVAAVGIRAFQAIRSRSGGTQ